MEFPRAARGCKGTESLQMKIRVKVFPSLIHCFYLLIGCLVSIHHCLCCIPWSVPLRHRAAAAWPLLPSPPTSPLCPLSCCCHSPPLPPSKEVSPPAGKGEKLAAISFAPWISAFPLVLPCMIQGFDKSGLMNKVYVRMCKLRKSKFSRFEFILMLIPCEYAP